MILAFDPGDITGYAVWSDTGELQWFSQMSLEELVPWLNTYPENVSAVIVEDFVLFAKRAQKQAGSRMKASKAIGALSLFAEKKNAQFVLQKANIKPIALKLTGITMPSQHSKTHQFDAYLHGMYWMIQQGIAKSKLQTELGA